MVEYTPRKIIKYLEQEGFKREKYFNTLYLEKKIKKEKYEIFLVVLRYKKYIILKVLIGNNGNYNKTGHFQIDKKDIKDMIKEIYDIVDKLKNEYEEKYNDVIEYIEDLIKKYKLSKYYDKDNFSLFYKRTKIIYRFNLSQIKDFSRINIEKILKILKERYNIFDLLEQKYKKVILSFQKKPERLLRIIDQDYFINYSYRFGYYKMIFYILGKKEYEKIIFLKEEEEKIFKKDKEEKSLIRKI